MVFVIVKTKKSILPLINQITKNNRNPKYYTKRNTVYLRNLTFRKAYAIAKLIKLKEPDAKIKIQVF